MQSNPLLSPLQHICSPADKGRADLAWSFSSFAIHNVTRDNLAIYFCKNYHKGIARMPGINPTPQGTNLRQPCSACDGFVKKHSTKSFAYKLHLSTTHEKNIIQQQVRFCVGYRIKLHASPRVQNSVNSFEFKPCDRTPQAGYLRVSCSTKSYLIPNGEGEDYRGL